MSSDEQTSIPDDDELEPLYHLDESGRLTWTEEGLRSYCKRFARFGIRIESVTTFDELQTARMLSAAGLDDQWVEIASRGPRSLERNLLVAFARRDDAEYRWLFALVEARNRLGLRVVG